MGNQYLQTFFYNARCLRFFQICVCFFVKKTVLSKPSVTLPQERNGTMILLAIAGGGGGMGRIDQTGPEDLEALMAADCDNSSCPEYSIRPGISYEYKEEILYKLLGMQTYKNTIGVTA